MLDVVAQLEAVGMESAFSTGNDRDLLLSLGEEVRQFRVSTMNCIVVAPDDGETEPQQDQPDQDDNGGRDQDGQEADTP